MENFELQPKVGHRRVNLGNRWEYRVIPVPIHNPETDQVIWDEQGEEYFIVNISDHILPPKRGKKRVRQGNTWMYRTVPLPKHHPEYQSITWNRKNESYHTVPKTNDYEERNRSRMNNTDEYYDVQNRDDILDMVQQEENMLYSNYY